MVNPREMRPGLGRPSRSRVRGHCPLCTPLRIPLTIACCRQVSDPRLCAGDPSGRRGPRGVGLTHGLPSSTTEVRVGTGPVSFDDVVAVCSRRRRRRAHRRGAGRDRAGARGRRGAGGGADAGVRHLDRLRRARDPAHPDRDARAAAEVAGPLARRRVGARGRAGGGPGADAAAALDAGDRAHRHPSRDRAARSPSLLSHGITPVVREYGSLGCSGDLAPLSHCALALMGEGEVRDASGDAGARRGGPGRGRAGAGRARRQGGSRADQRHRRDARHAGAGDPRPARAAAHRGRRRRDVASRPSSATDRVFAARAAGDPPAPGAGAVGGQPHRAARRLRRRRLAPRPGLQPGPGRLLAALLAAGARRRARHRRVRRGRGRPRAGVARSTTRSCSPRRGGSSRTATSTARRSPTSWTSWPSSPPTSPRSRSGVPTGSSTRPATTASRRSSPTTPAWTAGT